MLQPKGLRRTAQVGLWGRLTALIFNRPITEPHHLRRPEDMVVLDFAFENFALELGKFGRRLKPARPWKPSYLRVYLPPQHVGESRYKTINPGGVAAPGVEARMSGVSWLVFRRPADAPPTNFTAEGLLKACSEWPLVLSPNAAPTGDPAHTYTLADFADAHRLDLSDAKLDAVTQDLTSTAGRVVSLIHNQASARKPQPARAMRRWATEADRATARTARRLGLTADPAMNKVVRTSFDQAVMAKAGPDLAKLHDYGLTPFELTHAPGAPARPDHVTSIELPWRLRLSPTANGRFLSRLKPFGVNGRTELWHMRLTRLGSPEGSRNPPTVRAIWSPDWPDSLTLEGEAQNRPFKGPMGKRDRAELVSRMGDYTLEKPGGGHYTPEPATARRLELSALGGSIDVEGRWKDDVYTTGTEPAAVAAWAHKAELGRDSRVVVVRTGYLYPFGIRCAVTDVTERKIVSYKPYSPALGKEMQDGPGYPIAALVTKSFLSIGDPLKRYETADLPLDGRTFPFAEIEALDGVTPIETSSEPWYWPTRAGETGNMSFHLRGRDHAGRQASFRMPLLFVLIGPAYSGDTVTMDKLAGYYRSGGADANKERRTAALHGARLRLAPADEAGVDSLSFAVESVTFDADPLHGGSLSGGLHRFRPKVEFASVEAPGAAQFAGNAPPVEVKWDDTYAKQGFGATNPGELALNLTKPLPLFSPGSGGSSEKAGAMATPRMAVHGFSRKLGAVTGADVPGVDAKALDAVRSGKIDYATLLPDMKLFGVFPIAKLLQPPGDSVTVGLGDALQLKAEETPTAYRVLMTLSQVMHTVKVGDVLSLTPATGSKLYINAEARTPKDGGPAGQSVTAGLEAFDISFAGLVALRFSAIKFVTAPGKKPDLVLDFAKDGPLVFTGDLAFLQKLADVLPSSAFSDPPDLQITPEGLTAGYSLGLPPIAVGAASLTNIAFGASFHLPFLGDRPSLRLNFAERDAPFGVLVSLLGGGGFFAMEVDTGGVRVIEGTIEAQAGIAINLGVAAGAVTARLGIYYRWQLSPTETLLLEAFAELRGELSVLGLISASITFHVGLGILAQDGRKDLIGTATVTVEVEVLFFSKSVGIECHREFQGSNGDPTFADVYPAPALGEGGDKAWSAYASAFA